MAAHRTAVLAASIRTAGAMLLLWAPSGCVKHNVKEPEPTPNVRVSLANYGLPKDYARFDDAACRAHVIGYRFLVWLAPDLLIVGYTTSPSCRSVENQEVTSGNLRLLAFNTQGKLQAERDLAYAPDGGKEIVASGEATNGPGGSLLIRIEEADGAKSGVRLLDSTLRDVGQIDRFMETQSPVDHSMVFQEDVVWSGPRTYDVYDGIPLRQVQRVTLDLPSGTMDRKLGANGYAYARCLQELRPGQYGSTNVIHSGAHRRCVLNVVDRNASSWRV